MWLSSHLMRADAHGLTEGPRGTGVRGEPTWRGRAPWLREAMGSVKPEEQRAARMGFQDGFGQSREPEGRTSPEQWEEACRME